MIRWSYGVTTVPDRVDSGLTKQTLDSLWRAGFKDPHVFVDGRTSSYEVPMTTRCPPTRIAPHWILSLAELYLRYTGADRFAVFQDDLAACSNLRLYLEGVAYPEKGYLNLFTFLGNEDVVRGKPDGWYKSHLLDGSDHLQSGRGALGLVFDREAVLTLLGSRWLWEEFQDVQFGWRKIDGKVANAMNRAGFFEYVHNPSLLLHTGEISTKGASDPPALTFRGEAWNALESLPCSAT